MKKIISLILATAITLSMLCPMLSLAEETEFATNGAGSSFTSETMALSNGDVVAMQFAITANIKSIGIMMLSSSSNKTVTFNLYKWNENQAETQNGTSLMTYTTSEWARKEIVYFHLEGGLSQGEYLMTFELTEGDELKINWIKPAINNIRCYINDYYTPGSPQGIVVAENPTDSIFTYTSEPTEISKHTTPPESVIADDSAIAQMNIDSTLWGGVDGLGRTITAYAEAGNKKDKKVGIFYWTWHLEQSNGNSPINVNSIIEEYPDAKNDYNHEIWKTNKSSAYFWNEPLWGYYIESDDYVLRKHAELLTTAGVDFVVFDCTNQDATWESAYLNLLKVWDAARKDGMKTPQIAFMLPFSANGDTVSSLIQIYDAIYRKGLYQDLWFYWEGKPLVLAYESALSTQVTKQAEIYDFFTFKHADPAYMTTEASDSSWGWLSCYPQAVYKNDDGTVEQVTVGVAQNANYKVCYDADGNKTGANPCSAMNGPYNMGRSYTHDKNYTITYKYCGEEIKLTNSCENSKLYGFNFQEQWDYAISVDPEIVFVTGWNEWIAGRNEVWGGVANGFPDQCDDENSRDIEPTKGDLKDNYYMQLCDNIRRFKGMSVPVSQTKSKSIDITNGTSQWNDKNIISYNDYTNDTTERNNKGWKGCLYKADATRNDFKTMKVSYDDEYIYFYAETAENITDKSDSNWMQLLVDTVSSEISDNGYEGFEYIINRTSASENEVTVEKFVNGWNFETVGKAKYSVDGKIMQIAVPRSYLGLGGSKEVKFNFKWCDNNLTDGDIMTLYTEGDTAPTGRFTYMFSSTKTKKIKDKGCGSTINGSIILSIAFACVLLKKKKNGEEL